MSPEFIINLVINYPMTTPPAYFTGSITLDNFWSRTLNAWPNVRQVVELLS